MTSKNSWFNGKLILDTCRRNLWLLSLTFLAFFFSLPVATAIRLQNYNYDASRYLPERLQELIQSAIQSPFSISNPLVIFFLILGGVVAGCAVFYYLHNKKRVDFYHSLPCTRTQLFCTNFIAGFCLIVVPYLLNLIFSIIVIAANGFLGLLEWGPAFTGIGLHLLFFLAIYGVTILAGMLTGNLVIHFLLDVLFLVIGPAVVATYSAAMSTFYSTFYLWGDSFERWLTYSSPAARYIAAGAAATPMGVRDTLLLVIFILAIFVLSWFLYRKRSSEGAGHAVVFRAFQPIIKYPLIFLGTLLFGLFFHSFGDNYGGWGWLFFGFICGAFIVSRIIEIILAFDFRAISKHWKGLVVFAVLFAGFITIPLFDLTHFNTYLPAEAGEIQEVYLSLGNLDRFNSENSSYIILNAAEKEMSREEFDMARECLSEPENIANALAIAAYGVENNLVDHSYTSIGPDTYSISIVYHLTNGRYVARQYNIPATPEFLANLLPIFDASEYRERQYPILRADASQLALTSIHVLSNDSFAGFDNTSFTATQQQALAEALQQDVRDMQVANLQESIPLAVLEFDYYETPFTTILSENTTEDLYNMSGTEHFSVPIYDTFQNTLAVLTDLGYGADFFTFDMSRVNRIEQTVYTQQQENTVTYSNYGFTVTTEDVAREEHAITITEPEEIAATLAAAYPSQAAYYNIFLPIDESCNLEVFYLQPSGEEITIHWVPKAQ